MDENIELTEQGWRNCLKALEAKCDRYKEALERIVAKSAIQDCGLTARELIDIARAALEVPNGE